MRSLAPRRFLFCAGLAFAACASPSYRAGDAAVEPLTPSGPDGGASSNGGSNPDGGASSSGGSEPDGGAPSACLAKPLSGWAHRDRLWLGASLNDATEAQVTLDVRAQYLAGGYPTQGICTACDASCGGDWWGCWSGSGAPPGTFARDFASRARSRSELPYFTYYEILQASGANEGADEVRVAADATFMRRYFDDFRFFLQQLGGAALIHLEPDFWGYAQQLSDDPHTLPAAVSTANPTDCGQQEDSIAGMGRCLVSMVRKYAPEAKVGFHASDWATGIAALHNSDPSFDAAAEARKLAGFLLACGADGADFVALDSSDRDAGYYAGQGKDVWWDEGNQTLPDFHQALTWEAALTSALKLPAIWWQTPYGNMSLPDQDLSWRDNRLDYFFDHPDELVRANTVGFVFGAGESHQTRADTDRGHFVQRAQGYAGPTVCP
jgi:hypothetical protein